MRIAIDARKLRDFGIGTYIRNILIELSRLDQTTEYVVLCRPDDVESGDVLGRNFRMVPETAPPYSLDEQFRIPLALARERVDALARAALRAAAGDSLPVGGDHPRLHPPDVSAVPAEPAGLRLCARRRCGARPARPIAILTVSEASKRDILRFFDIQPEKVAVIYNAIDERFLGAGRHRADGPGAPALSARPSVRACMSATSSRTRTSSG